MFNDRIACLILGSVPAGAIALAVAVAVAVVFYFIFYFLPNTQHTAHSIVAKFDEVAAVGSAFISFISFRIRA